MNLWSHCFSQNTNKKLSRFLPSLHRTEILTIFCSYFERNDDFINSFWNWLTFSCYVANVMKSTSHCGHKVKWQAKVYIPSTINTGCIVYTLTFTIVYNNLYIFSVFWPKNYTFKSKLNTFLTFFSATIIMYRYFNLLFILPILVMYNLYFCHFLYPLCNVFFWTENLKVKKI